MLLKKSLVIASLAAGVAATTFSILDVFVPIGMSSSAPIAKPAAVPSRPRSAF